MRLFIAIQLTDGMKNALTSVQTFLRGQGVHGNFTKLDNLHLTLAFIGEYADPDYVLDAMRSVAFPPFSICLDGFGSFGDLYWSGIGGSEELAACVRRLRRTLAERGIPFDRKKFSPHITLLRKASFEKRAGFPGVTIPDAAMEVRSITLMRSDRTKNGMVYTELGTATASKISAFPEKDDG